MEIQALTIYWWHIVPAIGRKMNRRIAKKAIKMRERQIEAKVMDNQACQLNRANTINGPLHGDMLRDEMPPCISTSNTVKTGKVTSQGGFSQRKVNIFNCK